MANCCDYTIHVRGTKKATLMVLATTRCADDKPISYEGGTDEEFIIHYSRSCKWEPDVYCDKECWIYRSVSAPKPPELSTDSAGIEQHRRRD